MSGALRILFESADYVVATAGSIAETLNVARHDAPPLTLLDLTLPDGDGLTLVEPLRAAGCKTVVALTGHDDVATRDRCLTAGCAEVLVKPVPTRELIGKMSLWLA